MKTNTRLFALIILALCLTQAGLAQEGKKSVSVTITKEINGVKTVVDTSFTVSDEAEIDAILKQMGVDEPKPNQSIEKQIVIRELDGEKKRTGFDFHFDTSESRPMLGVWLDDDQDEAGVRISGVSPNSGAQKAGLRHGDVLTEIAGEEVNDEDAIASALKPYEPGDEVEVVYLRDEQVNTTTVTLKAGSSTFFNLPAKGERRDYNYNFDYNFDFNDGEAKAFVWNDNRAFLGIYPENIAAETAEKYGLTESGGIYIDKIVKSSSAEAAGLQQGDIITHLNGKRVKNPKDLTKLLETLKPGDPLDIQYLREGVSRNITAILGKKKENVAVAPNSWSRPNKGLMTETKKPYLGVYLENEEAGGVRITRVSPNTAAEKAGLEVGDIIVGMEDMEIDSYHDLSEAMQGFEPGQEIKISFERDGKTKREKVVLGEKKSMIWVHSDDADENIDIDIVIREFEDEEAGENLRQFMESPSLTINDFSYFPNPNDGKFRLRFELPERGDLNIRVYTTEGKVLYEEFKQGFSGAYNEQIDISDFVSEGVLFLQITQNGKGMADKIIIR